jgi:hypothetical protein
MIENKASIIVLGKDAVASSGEIFRFVFVSMKEIFSFFAGVGVLAAGGRTLHGGAGRIHDACSCGSSWTLPRSCTKHERFTVTSS